MGKPAVSLRYKLIALCAAGLLACGLLPTLALADDSQAIIASQVGASSGVASALADQVNDSTDFSSDDSQQASASQDARTSRVAPMLASGLFGSPAGIISSDVALDAAEPVVGSFTVDGLTYAVGSDGLTLVAVDAAAISDGAIAIPASVAYDGITCDVTSIGPYAFYLSGAASVALPASIASVDNRAFRSSDVKRVEVSTDNPNLASFDGALYSADKSRLLLIPEGRKGSVLLSCETEVVQASLFSHCSLVEAISVEEGGAAFSSWEGLLYDASGATLLRVPAGAPDITIHDGCTSIAAGALEGCVKLERINAPASVTSISPGLFESVPTITLPAQMAVQDGMTSSVASALADQVNNSADSSGAEDEAEVAPRRVVASSQGLEAPLALPDLGSTSASPSSGASGSTPQLTAMVALSSTDDDLPDVDPSSIEVALPEGADEALWQAAGFSAAVAPVASAQEGATSYATYSGSVAQYLPSGYYFSGQNFAGLGSPTIGTWGDGAAVSSYWYATDPGAQVVTFSSSYVGTYVSGYWDSTTNTGVHSIYSTATGQLVTGTWYADQAFSQALSVGYYASNAVPQAAYFEPTSYSVTWHAEGGAFAGHAGDQLVNEVSVTLADKAPSVSRSGYRLAGWATAQGGAVAIGPEQVTGPVTGNLNYYAVWERVDYDIGFDVDSEPDDADYPGDAKDDQSANVESGSIPIEDPKRPGYVFEGWVIPNAGGTEAVDQDLVYQGDDGKWYVDASKLPDYAGDDGRVELTARWTSVISVDVPSSVTFYADLVTQGQESREGVADGAFGQSKVANQSQVDLRVVGLESSAVKTTDSTLGADSVLKKASVAPPSTSTQKLLSLYPSTKQWTADDLKDPDAVGGSKAAAAVDFDLDDILLEKSFKADDFTIAAGGTLNMGYRLNLTETGQQLDYDKLSKLQEGQSASIANVSYTFAGDAYLGPAPSGDETDPLYVTVDEAFITANGLDGKAMAGTYGLADIKAAADDIASKVTVQPPAAGATADQVAAYWDTVQQQALTSDYYPLYRALLDKQVMNNGVPIDSTAPYFQLKVDGVYLPLQLIGICQDTKSDGTGKAGLTFQMRDIYAYSNKRSIAAGGGTFNYTYMNSSNKNSGGWDSSAMKKTLRSTFWGYLPTEVQSAIVGVDKHQQLYIGKTFNSSPSYLQETTNETVWLLSQYEVLLGAFAYNESEALTTKFGYVPFQYMAYAPGGTGDTSIRLIKTYNGSARQWWLRSAYRGDGRFWAVPAGGDGLVTNASNTYGAAPCFCL